VCFSSPHGIFPLAVSSSRVLCVELVAVDSEVIAVSLLLLLHQVLLSSLDIILVTVTGLVLAAFHELKHMQMGSNMEVQGSTLLMACTSRASVFDDTYHRLDIF
jgi:hypothetical protein